LVYNGPKGERLAKSVNLPAAPLGQAIAELASPLLARRMTATDYLADDIGQPAAKPLGRAMAAAGAKQELKAHGAWVLHRLGQLDEATQLRLANDESELVRVYARRIAAAQKNWSPPVSEMVLTGLHDDSPQVRRAAADALARQPHSDHIRPLLAALRQVPTLDEHLRHALRIALRNNLRAVDDPAKFADLKNDPANLRELMSVALGVNSPFAGSLLLASLGDAKLGNAQLAVYLRHIARNAPPEGLDRLAAVVQNKFPGNHDFQAELLLAINEGIVQRGLTPERGLLGWAEKLAAELLADAEAVEMHWVAEPAKGVPPSDIPWVVQTRSIPAESPKWKNHPHPKHPTASPWIPQRRASSDDVTGLHYITSLPPGGESLTGVLRSVPFAMPDELTFFINGHRGFPNDPEHDKNFVRLIDAKTGDELRRIYPPRHDTGVPVRWKLDRPREVVLEVVDGDDGAAFAWIGVARFSVGLELFREAGFLSSAAPGGERLTGVLRSREFAVPAKLRFLLAGYSGLPGKPANHKKYVQLVEAGSGRILQKTECTSGVTAEEIVWDLSAFAGRRARFEIVDRDTTGGFAWVAAGGFEPSFAPLPAMAPRRLAKRQLAAAQIARDLKLTAVLDATAHLATDPFAATAAREMAASAILGNGNMSQQASVAEILGDGSQPKSLRLAVANGGAHLLAVRVRLAKALGQAPADLQLQFARVLARNRPGAKALLGAVESGQAPAGLLLDPQVKSSFPKAAAKRMAALTAKLPKPNADRERLIAERVASFRETGGDAAGGRTTFATFCAACHQKGGLGGSIGPQLDGVSNRGVERLVEDILDPNRNVDVAFCYSIVKLKNGQTVLGLKRREVGESIVFADLAGAESNIAKSDIASQEQTTRSLMPEAIGQAIPPADFNNLLEFLLAK
jgi:putative heme-binding domain-containing protein